MPLIGDPAGWSGNTRQVLIRDTFNHILALTGEDDVHTGGVDASGKSRCSVCRATARHLFDSVGTAPLIYRKGGRELGRGAERWNRFSANVREVHVHSLEWNAAPAVTTSDAPEVRCGGCANGECCQNGNPCGCCGHVLEEDVKPSEPSEPRTVDPEVRAAAERLYGTIQQRRAFVRSRENMECLDSMRVVIDGVRAIIQRLPVEAVISSIEAPWTADTRRQAAAYRPTAEAMRPIVPEGTYDYGTFAPRPSKFAHMVSEYVARLVLANVPVWLHGPAGTGKSSAAHYAARQARFTTGPKAGQALDYYEVNLAGAMASAIKGKDRLKEFVESDFLRAYEFGGLVCLEEFSAAHPTVGTALNTALAASEYHNDADGRTIQRHPDFRCVVTDNSLGYGSAEFKRNDMDASTKDRFRVGRVYTGLDLELERSIFEDILEKAGV